MTDHQVLLEGGPRHGEEYTVVGSLDYLEMPTKRLPVGGSLFDPEIGTVMYRRDLNDPTVFRHSGQRP